jgi:type II secretory pathway pseudopilin PulG
MNWRFFQPSMAGSGGLSTMALVLNRSAYEQAQQLIKTGHAVLDERGDWSGHQPSAAEENDFIREHGYGEYGHWHLGVNEDKDEDTKERYEFPYGDLTDVRRSAVLAAESRAGEYKHRDIELAAAHLLGMLDEAR